jgi:hypothetical protein
MENEIEKLDSEKEPENQNSEENKETEDDSAALKERNKEELKKVKNQPKEEPIKNEPDKGFGYGEKTFIRNVLGAEPDDYDWISDVMQDTGKTLDDLEASKYFQAELKERKEARTAKDAVPTGSKRSGGGTRDTVDYWVAKGELPPSDQVELRRKVVKAKEKNELNRSKFTDIPVL